MGVKFWIAVVLAAALLAAHLFIEWYRDMERWADR